MSTLFTRVCRSSRWSDVPLIAFLSSLAVPWFAAFVYFLGSDMEGVTKVRSAIAVLVPAILLSVLVGHVWKNPTTTQVLAQDTGHRS